MAENEKRYSTLERADYYAKMAKTGKSGDKKLTDAQKAACLVKAARLQNQAQRAARVAEYYQGKNRK